MDDVCIRAMLTPLAYVSAVLGLYALLTLLPFVGLFVLRSCCVSVAFPSSRYKDIVPRTIGVRQEKTRKFEIERERGMSRLVVMDLLPRYIPLQLHT
jgi:hypothetical protein